MCSDQQGNNTRQRCLYYYLGAISYLAARVKNEEPKGTRGKGGGIFVGAMQCVTPGWQRLLTKKSGVWSVIDVLLAVDGRGVLLQLLQKGATRWYAYRSGFVRYHLTRF